MGISLLLISMSWTDSHRWILRFGNKKHLDQQQLNRSFPKHLLGDTPHAQTAQGSSLVHFSALTLHADKIIPILHKWGANMNLEDNRGATPLHWAITNPDCPQAISVLLYLGANPTAKDHDGNTALHYAAQHGRTGAAKLLVDREPSLLFSKNKMRRTPLAVACREEEITVAGELLSCGAPVTKRLFKRAVRSHSTEVVELLLSEGSYSQWPAEERDALIKLAEKKKRKPVVRALTL